MDGRLHQKGNSSVGQHWDVNPVNDLSNIGSDVWSFLSGPPGDPGRIRRVASQIETMGHECRGHVTAINEAIDELGYEWRGDAATAFLTAWHSPAATGPQGAMTAVADGLTSFARQLNDYADRLEHAQHEHWVQLAVMGVLTVVDVAQLGLDPLTDAAAVGIGAATAIGVPFVVAQVGVFGIEGALVNFAADVIAQVGADAWDHLDGEFDGTGDHAVGFFDPQEAATSALQGAVSFGVARSGGEVLEATGGGNVLSKAMLNPATRIATVAAFSLASDAASQLLTTGHVEWEEAAISGGIGGLAGGHVWRADDVGSVDAVGRFHDPATADPARYATLRLDPARTIEKTGMGGGADEATSAMRLEHVGLVDGPITRSANGKADFQDASGKLWDVKSPQSVIARRGQYDFNTTMSAVRSEVVNNNENVMLNTAYLTSPQARELIMAVRASPDLAGRVIFTTSRDW